MCNYVLFFSISMKIKDLEIIIVQVVFMGIMITKVLIVGTVIIENMFTEIFAVMILLTVIEIICIDVEKVTGLSNCALSWVKLGSSVEAVILEMYEEVPFVL